MRENMARTTGELQMSKSGGCRCGAVRYEASGEPTHSTLCWCKECRGSAGAPAVLWTLFARENVRIEGEPRTYESSPGTMRQFCGTCGTGLFYLNEAIFPGQIDIQGATFDEADAFAPQAHIQVADAPVWITDMAALPKFDRYPSAPD
jgi:hypothetical protein